MIFGREPTLERLRAISIRTAFYLDSTAAAWAAMRLLGKRDL